MNSCCNNSVIKYTQGNNSNFILHYYEFGDEIDLSWFDVVRVTLLRDGVMSSDAHGDPYMNNSIMLQCPASLPAGRYSLETIMKRGDAVQRRSFLCGVIEIVECDQEANIGQTEVMFGDTSEIQVKIQYANVR